MIQTKLIMTFKCGVHDKLRQENISHPSGAAAMKAGKTYEYMLLHVHEQTVQQAVFSYCFTLVKVGFYSGDRDHSCESSVCVVNREKLANIILYGKHLGQSFKVFKG